MRRPTQFRPRRLKQWLLLRLLGQYAEALENQEKAEEVIDRVYDVMDSVCGWCSPNARLD